jgi:small-conductance mechanosensitive channel
MKKNVPYTFIYILFIVLYLTLSLKCSQVKQKSDEFAKVCSVVDIIKGVDIIEWLLIFYMFYYTCEFVINNTVPKLTLFAKILLLYIIIKKVKELS